MGGRAASVEVYGSAPHSLARKAAAGPLLGGGPARRVSRVPRTKAAGGGEGGGIPPCPSIDESDCLSVCLSIGGSIRFPLGRAVRSFPAAETRQAGSIPRWGLRAGHRGTSLGGGQPGPCVPRTPQVSDASEAEAAAPLRPRRRGGSGRRPGPGGPKSSLGLTSHKPAFGWASTRHHITAAGERAKETERHREKENERG